MKEMAELFRAFGDETRLAIIGLLLSGERTIPDIAQNVKIATTAVSRHLMILRVAGVTKRTKRGRTAYYSIQQEAFKTLNVFIRSAKKEMAN